jgi:prophage maintenance system killer protein
VAVFKKIKSGVLSAQKVGRNYAIDPENQGFQTSSKAASRLRFRHSIKKHLYRGLIEKTAVLFYLMIKNHPFSNGGEVFIKAGQKT